MSFATNMQSVASNLLTKYGRPVSFSRTVEGDYDPTTSGVNDIEITNYEGVAHPSPYTVAELATGTVTVKDVKLLTYCTTLPLIGDTVVIDDETYRIMNVGRVSAQGKDIIYQLQIRI